MVLFLFLYRLLFHVMYHKIFHMVKHKEKKNEYVCISIESMKIVESKELNYILS